MATGLIWAQAHDRVIGRDGSMPWHLPEDLAHFKATTSGATVVMGRRTWESFPPRFRPLPGRTNVVITGRPDWSDDGAVVVHSLAEALDRAGDIWVIGGARVYAEAMAYADTIVVTEIDAAYDGDTYAPVVDAAWIVADTGEWRQSAAGPRYRIIRYRRADAHRG